jgi:hypothetical protein
MAAGRCFSNDPRSGRHEAFGTSLTGPGGLDQKRDYRNNVVV